MRRFFGLLGMGLLTCGWLAADDEMLIVRGVEGEAVYGEQFDEEMALWEAAAKVAGVPAMVVQPDGKESQGERVLNEIEGVISRAPSRLWLVMTGHGTFDGREARFTVEGEDLMPEDVVEALQGFEGELVFVHSGSASQPFGKALAGPKRICVTATKSGSEVFLTHFGVPFAKAIGGEPKADLDQDGQVSVLEAFLHAASQVSEFYETEERLATEHAVLDDTGDGIGIRSERFEGARLAVSVADADGELARRTVLVLSEEERRLTLEQRGRRDELEAELEALKSEREALGDDAFFPQAERVLREIGEIYREGEIKAGAVP